MNFVLVGSTPPVCAFRPAAVLRAEIAEKRGDKRKPSRPADVPKPPPRTEPPKKSERRVGNRRPMKVGGNIGLDESHWLGCTVLDMSASGAMLQVPEPSHPRDAVPDHFYLVIDNLLERCVVSCRVCWRHGDRLGVQFMGPIEATLKKAPARSARRATGVGR